MSYCQMLRSDKTDAAARPVVSMAWAVLALVLALAWQFLTVHYNRDGNWTALFLTGENSGIPPDLASQTYKFPGRGFDGEMYRYVAHDLFRNRGYVRYVDGPAQRYHRILVPALAYLLVAGYQPWIDASYIAVVAIFVLLGAYWLSRWAVLVQLQPAWALAFLLVPATLISIDRMTVDIALAAFTVAMAVYWRSGDWTKLFVVLLLACLARETGALLVGGCCLAELLKRKWIRVALWASSALPALVWYLYIRRTFTERTHLGVPVWIGRELNAEMFQTIFSPNHYPLAALLDTIARWGDRLSLVAIVLAALLAFLFFSKRPVDGVAIAAALFAIVIPLLTGRGYWNDVNGYARVLSPLLMLVALGSLAREGSVRWWTGLIPIILIDLRLSMEFAGAAGGIIRGLMR
jgi:hypothetical protein